MNDHPPPESLAPPTPPQLSPLRLTLTAWGRQLGRWLSTLWGPLFEDIDQMFYDLADATSNPAEYARYFDAQREVRCYREQILNDFLRVIGERAETLASDHSVSGSQPGTFFYSPEAARMPGVDAADEPCLHALIRQEEERYEPQLRVLEKTLAQQLGFTWDPTQRINPYAPANLSTAFARSMRLLPDLDLRLRQQVYDAFASRVLDPLGEFYGDCCATLVAEADSDTVPILMDEDSEDSSDLTQVMGEGVAEDLPRFSRAHGGYSSPGTEDSAEVEGESLSAARRRLGAVKSADAETRRGMTVEQTQRAREASQRRSELERSISGLDSIDESTLDLMFMFFEHLMQGNDLPDPIKVMIGRMQIPVTKLALLDGRFLSDPEHPARQLLNHIGQAAVGWSEADGRGPNTLFSMIERVTERLITDFDNDLELFRRMDRYFQVFLEREQQQANSSEKALLAEQMAALKDPERESVQAAIFQFLRPYVRIPLIVDVILQRGWEPYMLVVYRRKGMDSDAWRDALMLVETLLWSVTPQEDPAERRRLLQLIPAMLRSLREGLLIAGRSTTQIASWFNELQILHLGVLQGSMSGARLSLDLVPGAGATEQARVRIIVGDWIERIDADGSRARWKLVWYRPDTHELVFVDRHGLPGPKLSFQELERGMIEGSVLLLTKPREPLTDRALRTVRGHLPPS